MYQNTELKVEKKKIELQTTLQLRLKYVNETIIGVHKSYTSSG